MKTNSNFLAYVHVKSLGLKLYANSKTEFCPPALGICREDVPAPDSVHKMSEEFRAVLRGSQTHGDNHWPLSQHKMPQVFGLIQAIPHVNNI